MSGFHLTPAAARDLSEIWDYTEQSWSAQQAEHYLNDIRTAVERLAANPDLGRPCDEIREAYRRYPSGRHLLFFVARDGGVDIIRILHQRMDPTRHL